LLLERKVFAYENYKKGKTNAKNSRGS
jgi:hypothetical protein